MKNTLLTLLVSFALPAVSYAAEPVAEPAAKSGGCCKKGCSRAAQLEGAVLTAALEEKSGKTCASKEACDDKEACGDAVTYAVAGMTCQGGSKKVATAVKAVEGVADVEVCHKSGTATVMVAEGKEVKADAVMAAVKEAGFEAEGQVVFFRVNNMTCGGCSGSLTKTLAETEGVVSVKKVCHAKGTASVVINPAETDNLKIATAINATKFKVAE